MKYVLLFIAILGFSQEAYESGKIDMHGGKSYMYTKDKGNMKSKSMEMSNFLDTNTTKTPLYKKK